MKILFSPSESKSSLANLTAFDETSFIFKDLFSKRLEVLDSYKDFVSSAKIDDLRSFFDLKDEKESLSFREDIFLQNTCEAIQRYNGVAYEYLDFETLDEDAKNYIRKNVLIFSNLFGPIRASDPLPRYRLKQGAKIQGLCVENFYKKHFSKALDEMLKDEEVIDLRASFYEKFYKLAKKFYTYKFVKNSKVVSHFAKAYRGILLRTLALNGIEKNEDLLDNLPSNLKVLDIKILGNKEEISLEIL